MKSLISFRKIKNTSDFKIVRLEHQHNHKVISGKELKFLESLQEISKEVQDKPISLYKEGKKVKDIFEDCKTEYNATHQPPLNLCRQKFAHFLHNKERAGQGKNAKEVLD